TGGADQMARLWDVPGGKELAVLRGHTGDVLHLAFSPDGKVLATGSADRTVKLWDAITGEERGTLKEHAHEVTAVAFGPDGRTLAAAGAAFPLDDANAIFVRHMVQVALGPGQAVQFIPGPVTGEVKLWKAATDRDMAAYHHREGEQQEGVGLLAEAERSYRRAVKLAQQLADGSPGEARYRQEVAPPRHNPPRVLHPAGTKGGGLRRGRHA